MSKIKKQYSCTNCGSVSYKWSGQCPDCGSWGTITEEINTNNSLISIGNGTVQIVQSLTDKIQDVFHRSTPIMELNRVLGGGLVPGSAILVGGDPGIGKSTLLLQLSASLADHDVTCIYITGEESTNQVKLRAKRLKIEKNATLLLAATNVEDIIATIEQHKARLSLIIIDSIQTMMTSTASSAPGTVSQIKASAHILISYAKQNNITLLLTCHVNKEGQLAGPKILEHIVDSVLYFDGEHNNHFRILRSVKNRFGAVNEIGVFEMTATGLVEISNPSELFLLERENNISGTAVFAGLEGSRPLLIEIQALIAPTNMVTPRRSVVGWDANRLSMIIAVLGARFGLNLATFEVYLSVAGGLRITEPAADLAVAAALISARNNRPLPEKSIFFGEIGLSGEVRKVPQTETRLKEAVKLGFKQMYYCFKEEAKNKEHDDYTMHLVRHLIQLKGLI